MPPPLDNPNSPIDLRGLNGHHDEIGKPGVSNTTFEAPDWWHRHYPGVSTFFEARLTAIPVSSINTNTSSTTSGGTGGSSSTSGSSNSNSSSSGTSSDSFLTTQKTARLDAGVYLPFLLTRWEWGSQPNSLFAAPLVKVGFDTITGSQQQTVTDQNRNPVQISLDNLYKFDGFGVRIGHFFNDSHKSPLTRDS